MYATVGTVLKELEKDIEYGARVYIRPNFERLSIFDWWVEYLSVTRLKEMKKFLKEAKKLGFDGYCCFKVGASGCANGMWAYKELSTDGYSPNGDCIYKLFTPSYEYWDAKVNGEWLPKKDFGELRTIKQFEKCYYSIVK